LLEYDINTGSKPSKLEITLECPARKFNHIRMFIDIKLKVGMLTIICVHQYQPLVLYTHYKSVQGNGRILYITFNAQRCSIVWHAVNNYKVTSKTKSAQQLAKQDVI
jgi:hypothetical protein